MFNNHSSKLIFLFFISIFCFCSTLQSKDFETTLAEIKSVEHSNVALLEAFSQHLLMFENNEQAQILGKFYFAKSQYYCGDIKEAVEIFDGLYKAIKSKKNNYLKYEIDIFISEYYYGQNNFVDGGKRLENIEKYANGLEYEVALFTLKDYITNSTFKNVGERLKTLQSQVEKADKKNLFSYNKQYYLAKLKNKRLINLSRKNKKKFHFINVDSVMESIDSIKHLFDINIQEFEATNLLIPLVGSMLGKIYAEPGGMGNSSDSINLKVCNKAIKMVEKQENYGLLARLYNTKAHLHNNINELEAAYNAFGRAANYAELQNDNAKYIIYTTRAAMMKTFIEVGKKENFNKICLLYEKAIRQVESFHFSAFDELRNEFSRSKIRLGDTKNHGCFQRLDSLILKLKNEYGESFLIQKLTKNRVEENKLNKVHENRINKIYERESLKRQVKLAVIGFIIALLMIAGLAYNYRQKHIANKKFDKQNQFIYNQNIELKKTILSLERAKRNLENFAFSIAHDIKAPLRNINVFSQLIEIGLPQNYENKELFKFINDGCNTINQFIEKMLFFSSTLVKEEPNEKVDLKVELPNTLNKLGLCNNSKVKISIGELPVMNINKDLILKLFIELIENAIKFKTPGKNCDIKIGYEKKLDDNIFTIKDNGIGISETDKKQIFQLLKKVHTNTEYDGFGIGLNICQKIVNYYNGKIWVESEPNRGATFCFTLPPSKFNL